MTGSDCSGKTKMEAGPGRHIVGSLDVILWQRDGLINLIMSLPFFLPLLSFLLVSIPVSMCSCHSQPNESIVMGALIYLSRHVSTSFEEKAPDPLHTLK